MNIAYVCRGYPGLGKVMGALALHQSLEGRPGYRGTFLSYHQGHKFLCKTGYSCLDVMVGDAGVATDDFCTPFSAVGRKVLRALEELRPDFVVNDGEPYLIEMSQEMLDIPTVVLAHPLDLCNADNQHGVRLFRHYYRRAAHVIAHGLTPLAQEARALGGRADRVEDIRTLVRKSIWRAALGGGAVTNDGPAVCVLGGGSVNSGGPFLERTIELGRWFLRACLELGLERPILFCSDDYVHSAVRDCARRGVQCVADPVDNVEALCRASVVVGRAGRNLASEVLALGKRAVLVPVSGASFRLSGQSLTADMASTLSKSVTTSAWSAGYDGFEDALQQALQKEPRSPEWEPGNSEALGLIDDWLLRG